MRRRLEASLGVVLLAMGCQPDFLSIPCATDMNCPTGFVCSRQQVCVASDGGATSGGGVAGGGSATGGGTAGGRVAGGVAGGSFAGGAAGGESGGAAGGESGGAAGGESGGAAGGESGGSAGGVTGGGVTGGGATGGGATGGGATGGGVTGGGATGGGATGGGASGGPPSCANGCVVNGTTCLQAGTQQSNTLCGFAGAVCSACAGNSTCSSGFCTPIGGGSGGGVPCGCSAVSPTACGCLLTAVRPDVARTGDVIWLEGRFGSTATVSFPGGGTQTLPSGGVSRLALPVPATATAGSILVTTEGTTLQLPFRRATFGLGVGGFDPEYPQTQYARAMPRLVTPRAGATATRIGNRVFVIGGGLVESASINADGTWSNFKTEPVLVPSGRVEHTAHLVGPYLYLLGGRVGSTPLATVERATILANGSLSNFTNQSGVSLVVARSRHASVVIGDTLYAIGGSAGFLTLASIERSVIGGDGTLGPFASISVALGTARQGHAAVVVGNSLYVIGGSSAAALPPSTGALNTIERANLTPALQAFTTALSLNTPRISPAVMAFGNRIWVIGGSTSSTTNEVVTLDSGGAVTAVSFSDSTLSQPRVGGSLVQSGNVVHLVGGASAAPIANAEVATINTTGQLGAYVALGPLLTTERGDIAPVVAGDRLWFIGGAVDGGSTESALVLPDGTLAPFVRASTLLTPNRGAHRTAVVDDTIFVIGGVAGPPNTSLQTVERVEAYADGGISSFANAGTLVSRRSWATTAVVSNTLHVFGGYSYQGSYWRTFETASLAPGDGGVNLSFTQSTAQLAQFRWYATNVVTRAGVHVLGGFYGGYLASMERSPLPVGAFAITTEAMARPRGDFQVAVIGPAVFALAGFSVNPDPTDAIDRAVFYAPSHDAGVERAIGGFTTLTTPTVPARTAGHMVIELGNRLYLFMGAQGGYYPLQ